MKSGYEIFDGATVACSAMGSCNEKFIFPTCGHQQSSGSGVIKLLQKFLNQEPWNINARYLLTLNCFQKAREERFPIHVCRVLDRLISVALSNQFSSNKDANGNTRVFSFYCTLLRLICNKGLAAVWFGDFVPAEEFFAEACSLADVESCLFLCHGAICLELARQKCESQYITRAVRSLKKAKDSALQPLPFISLLLAQAEASLGSKAKWEINLRDEWFSWPPETKPAELLFQMNLLARQQNDGDSSLRWILRAIHVNPSCSRYWNYLLKDM